MKLSYETTINLIILKMNIKKSMIKLLQIFLITFCCLLFAIFSIIFQENYLLTLIQISVFFWLFYCVRQSKNIKIWEYAIWFVFFPCYYIYGKENPYQTGWYSRSADVFITGISNAYYSISQLFYTGNSWQTLAKKFIREHNPLILFQIYSCIFFISCTTILFLVKKKYKVSIDSYENKKKCLITILVLLFMTSLAYHIYNSKTDKSFKYHNNVQLWNFSLFYISIYCIIFLLFLYFKKWLTNLNQTFFIILGVLVISFFSDCNLPPKLKHLKI